MKHILLLLTLISTYAFAQPQNGQQARQRKAIELNKQAFKTLYSAGDRPTVRYKKVFKLLDSAIKIDPTLKAAYQIKMRTLITLDRYNDALKTLNILISLSPTLTELLITKGVLLDKTGQKQAARNIYQSIYPVLTRKYTANPTIGRLESVAISIFLLHGRQEAIDFLDKEAPKFSPSITDYQKLIEFKTIMASLTKDKLLGKNRTVVIVRNPK